ncbi:aminoglycoside phosphotransferase family protein [Sporosarcina sp. 6E9]|uniref:aminoglycoside phosphotransferase family protein n=1 Tax=Sporosarcina sp. 6E9 TaxID=2819235 RepID=UPI001B3163CF|nr:phosphotransferase [Sporosarcina sp. 6E9]
MDIRSIPFLKNNSSFEFIEEGFSADEKWCVDHTYLVRISPNGDRQRLDLQANLVKAANKNDSHIPFVHEVGVHDGSPYMILDYIKGENGRVMLPKLSQEAQYRNGQQVGQTLYKMHQIPAPINYPAWDHRWITKVERLLPRFSKIAVENKRYEKVARFVMNHLHLIYGRPSCVQHYDFHPGNILIHEEQFTGLIDMQKITYADPINEFYKMEYFNVPISKAYSRGVLDGYHDNNAIPTSFWKLHRLYAAIHIMSAEVWANEIALDQQERFKIYTDFTLSQFDDFDLLIPKWYAGES